MINKNIKYYSYSTHKALRYFTLELVIVGRGGQHCLYENVIVFFLRYDIKLLKFQKADPTQFLQLHGRPVKIHLDPAVAMAGDSPANM